MKGLFAFFKCDTTIISVSKLHVARLCTTLTKVSLPPHSLFLFHCHSNGFAIWEGSRKRSDPKTRIHDRQNENVLSRFLSFAAPADDDVG